LRQHRGSSPTSRACIEEDALIDYLSLVWTGDRPERTPFADVALVLPGTALVVDAHGARATTYWRPFEAPAIRLRAESDYVDLFLDRFRTAVRTRLRSSRAVASTLSSGLDSSAVTSFAAEALAERGAGLLAFTSVPAHVPADRPAPRLDEWPLAHAVAARCGNVEHVAIRGRRFSPVTAIPAALDRMLHPQHAVANLYWLLDLLAEARERGVGVLLTGQLGNAGVSWSGGTGRILYLLVDGRIDEARRALDEWRRRHGLGWLQAIRGQVLEPILRPLAFRARAALSPDRGLLAPDVARRIGLRRRAVRNGLGHHVWPPMRPALQRMLILMVNGRLAGPLWQALGATHGLEVRDPTADVRLLDVCGAMPAELDVQDGEDRAWIRAAMRGRLPEEVRLGALRARQAADLAERVVAHPDEVDAALAAGRAAPFVDVARLREDWGRLAAGPARAGDPARNALAARLLRGLMAAQFLDRVGRSAAGRSV
jgi:asparagine synthase (glutamine-hydrolysing)